MAILSSEESILTNITGYPLSQLEAISAKVDAHYYMFPISKGKTKKRWINAPRKDLKHIQNQILRQLLYQAPVHHVAHGFVPNRSIVTNARPHVGKKWVANFDIHSFFPSTKKTAVQQTINRHFSFSEEKTALITNLCTKAGELPQGAPTSPHIANLVMWDADTQLETYATEHALIYTRYADDLTFSGSEIPQSIRSDISTIINTYGYSLAHHKSKILGQHRRQMVTGLVVNEKLNLPRPLRKRLRAIVHDIQSNGAEHALSRSTMNIEQIIGRIALQYMWDRDQADAQLMELAYALQLIPSNR